MKIFKYIVDSGAFMLLTSIIGTACTDGNDWNVDSTHDRLFSVTASDISVSAKPTSAEVSWRVVPDAEYYVMEYSTDSLYDEIAMGGTEHSVIVGEDKSIVESPYTITGLQGETKYFLRIKSMSSAKADSKWTYLEKYSFKTSTEQILNEVASITGESAVLSWTEGAEVTSLKLAEAKDDVEEVDTTYIELDAAAVAASSYTLTGLSPKTKYSVSIYNGNVKRGTRTFTTTESYPAGYDIINVTDAEMLNDVFSNPANYIQENGGNVVLVFANGSTTDYMGESLELTIPAELKSVIFWGESGDTRPVFMPKGLSMAGSHDLIRFYNLDLQNTSSGSDYIVNFNVEGNVGEILIDNCNISKTRGVVRVQSDGAKGSIGSINIDNCVLTDIGSYAIVQTKVSGFTLNSISLSNSTISTVNAGGVLITQQDNVNISIDACTFYNCVTSGKSFIDINKMSNVTVDVKNTIIGQLYSYTSGSTIKATSVKNIATTTNLFTTTDCPYNSGYEWGEMLNVSSTELFVNPAEGDFHIQSASQSDVAGAGDPRWNE
jgi:hypothetical protein